MLAGLHSGAAAAGARQRAVAHSATLAGGRRRPRRAAAAARLAWALARRGGGGGPAVWGRARGRRRGAQRAAALCQLRQAAGVAQLGDEHAAVIQRLGGQQLPHERLVACVPVKRGRGQGQAGCRLKQVGGKKPTHTGAAGPSGVHA